MERAVVMVRTEQREKLAHLAARERVSAAEINRRAIDAYNPYATNEDDLEQLAEFVIQSNVKAMRALQEAHKAVKQTLAYFADKAK